MLLAIVWICAGVTIASVSDVHLNAKGVLFALSGVLVTAHYQIAVGTTQKDLQVNSMQVWL